MLLCRLVFCDCSNSQLTILAPGYSIDAGGVVLSGTSQATPFVSGALSVLQQRYPAYTGQQLIHQLTSTGIPVRAEGWQGPAMQPNLLRL